MKIKRILGAKMDFDDFIVKVISEAHELDLLFKKTNQNEETDEDYWLELLSKLNNIEAFTLSARRKTLAMLVEHNPENANYWLNYSTVLFYFHNERQLSFESILKAATILRQGNDVYGAVSNHLFRVALELKDYEEINAELSHLIKNCSDKSHVPVYFLNSILPKLSSKEVDIELIEFLKRKWG